MRRTTALLVLCAPLLAACAGADTGGAVGDQAGTAPLRAGVTTTTPPPTPATAATPPTPDPATARTGAATRLTAALSGKEEVPGPGDPDGTATIVLTLRQGGEVCAVISTTAIDTAVAAHVHTGASGTAGPVLVTIPTPISGKADRCVTATPEQVAQIVANPAGFYVNIHSRLHPDGAIRGQLAKG